MKPFLMGTETEYSVSGRQQQRVMAADEVYALLNEAVRRERLWMPDVIGGRSIYLEHGGRFYMDHGAHPEYATPECLTPTQVACYDKAGERLLEVARERVLRDRPGVQIVIVKNNLDPIYPDHLTFGCHESYTSWVQPDHAAARLIPHLVSRIIYAGAGCLSAHPSGSGFELSQRARHLVKVVGNETTSNRAIFCTRIRKSSDAAQAGWTRAYLIGKDSQRAPFGIYLTFATTGLLFEMLNRKKKIGKGLELANALHALREISCDPWLKTRVALSDGRRLTALEIQEAYLVECEREVEHGDLPDWAPEAVRHWRATLTALTQDPLLMAGKLDPYCKLLLYGHELKRSGQTWQDLHDGLQRLSALRASFSAPVLQALLAENAHALPPEAQADYRAARVTLEAGQADGLERLRLAVRMQALDIRYHELGGLYDWLAALGKVENVVLTREDVERASREPPAGGRAALRGGGIKAHREPDWVCDWQYLFQGSSGRCVDMRDPFAGEERTVYLQMPTDEEEHVGDVLSRLARTTGH